MGAGGGGGGETTTPADSGAGHWPGSLAAETEGCGRAGFQAKTGSSPPFLPYQPRYFTLTAYIYDGKPHGHY